MPISSGTAMVFQHDAQHRALLACVGVSIALHALVLAFPDWRSSPSAASPKALTAWFAPQPPEAMPRSEAVPPRARREKEAPPLLAAPTSVAIPQETETVRAPEPSPAASNTEPARTEVAPAREVLSQSAPGEVIAKPQRDPADDAAMRRQYLIALVDAAKLYMRYPPQARERGWEGRVEVRLMIGTNGSIKSAIVKTSSRYQILDDQALDMVKKGQQRLQVPPALRGREFSVDIPVTFELLTG